MLSAMGSIASIKGFKLTTPPPTDFAFKIKDGVAATVAGTGYSTTYNITNTGSVAIVPTVSSRTNVMSFSGSNYFTVPYAIPATNTTTFWLYTPANITTAQTIHASPNYVVQFNSTPYLKQTIAIGSFPTPYTSTVIQPVSTWQFYCVVMSPTAGKMYINGEYVGEQSGNLSVGTNAPITFGASNDTLKKYTGYMDDIRLYERELSAAEIRALYNTPNDFVFKIKGGTSVPTATTAGTGYSTTYPITNTGTVITTATAGTRTNAITLSGTNYLQISYNSPVVFTRTFWLSTTTTAGNSNVGGSQKTPVWFNGTTFLRASVNFNSTPWTNCVSTVAQSTAWLFYAIIQTSTTVSMYVNGVLVASVSGTNWVGDTGVFQFGAYGGSSGYTGYMDDMRLYERVLSTAEIQALYANEIQALYNTPNDFVFKIKGGTSVPTATTAGTGYSTTYPITNTGAVVTTATAGTRTNAITLSGANYLQISYNLPVIFTRTFWLSSATPQSNTGNVFSSVKNPVYFSSTTLLHNIVNFGASPWTECISTVAQTSTWLFYAITQTSTTVSMYVNGIVVATLSGTGWVGDTGTIQFGAYNGNINNYTGNMDDMRIYARELSATEIQTLYTAG